MHSLNSLTPPGKMLPLKICHECKEEWNVNTEASQIWSLAQHMSWQANAINNVHVQCIAGSKWICPTKRHLHAFSWFAKKVSLPQLAPKHDKAGMHKLTIIYQDKQSLKHKEPQQTCFNILSSFSIYLLSLRCQGLFASSGLYIPTKSSLGLSTIRSLRHWS